MDARVLAEMWVRALVDESARLDFALHQKQRRFVHSEARHVAFVGGIGSGKSYGGCVRALRASQGFIGERRIRTPNLGAITAPTYPMLRDATLRTFFEVAEGFVDKFNKADGLITMKNGSEIITRSTEHPDRLRGANLSWWFGDEAAMYQAVVRRIMLGRLRQFGAAGWDWQATTPRGRDWVYQTYVTNATDDHELIQATSAENTFLDREIIAAWEREYSGDFARQELGGEFVAFEGLIYNEFNRRWHVARPEPGRQYARVIAGVDWGFANPGVILVFGVDGDGRVIGLAEQYQTQRRVEEWVQVAGQLRAAWGVDTFYCDPSEPDYIQMFREAGLRATKADNRVLPGIQAVKNALVVRDDGRAGLTVSPDMAHTLAEFEQYQWMAGRDGLKDQPVKANDHAMDALRYAVMAAAAPSGKRTGKVRRFI